MNDIASILGKKFIKDMYIKMGMQNEENELKKYCFDKYNFVNEFNINDDRVTG